MVPSAADEYASEVSDLRSRQPDGDLVLFIRSHRTFIGKECSAFEALALVTLVKYGLWAVVMNVLVLVVTGSLHWTGYMLIASHFAMAVQGVLYAPHFRFKGWHLALAAVWTLHNDAIDYLFGMMPNYSMLDQYMPQIGYFTFWLSIASIGLAYYLVLSRKAFKL